MEFIIKSIKYILLIIINLNLFSAEIADEYELKAAFIEKFARFIEWPNETDNPNSTFDIMVLGENPFKKKLDNLYSNQKIKNKNVKIKYINSIEQIGDCNILFISPSLSSNLNLIFKKISKKPILTISQFSNFCKKGGNINFIISNSKIKFEINEKSIKNANLKISHLLLKNSIIVNTEDE